MLLFCIHINTFWLGGNINFGLIKEYSLEINSNMTTIECMYYEIIGDIRTNMSARAKQRTIHILKKGKFNNNLL